MFAAIEHPLEVRLKEILEKIVGVGTVDVLVTVDSTEEIDREGNTQESQQVTDENDPNGGTDGILRRSRKTDRSYCMRYRAIRSRS